MKLFPFSLGLTLSLLCACSEPLKDPYVFDINFEGRDTCFTKILNDTPILFFREIEIIENTINDTFRIGRGVVRPGYIGKLSYLQMGSRTDAFMYREPNPRNMPKTDQLCFQQHNPTRVTTGRIKVRVYTK